MAPNKTAECGCSCRGRQCLPTCEVHDETQNPYEVRPGASVR